MLTFIAIAIALYILIGFLIVERDERWWRRWWRRVESER